MNQLFLILLFLLSGIINAQIISGNTQSENGKPLPEVNIYIDGSKIHTISNANGDFSIDIQNQKNANLVFQKDQHETNLVKISEVLGKKVKVVMNKMQDIEEVVLIPYTSEAYQKYINYFLNEFIGYDQTNVKIKNQRTLKFAYDKKNKTLKVKAPNTLTIENKKLGYQIQYNLLNFEANFNANTVSYTGTSFFKETNQKIITKSHRQNAYYGSIMHFLRSVYQNKVAEEGYWVNHIQKIETPKPAMAVIKTKIPPQSYFQNTENQKNMTFKDILQVNYPKYYTSVKKSKILKSASFVQQTSYIYMDGNTFEIYPDGNSSDPDLMIIQGELSNKIGALLPLDYQPEN